MLKRVEELTPVTHTPSPWILDDFLQSKKSKILATDIGRNNRYRYFPAHGRKTNLSTWDMSMVCHVLSFLYDASSPEWFDIEDVKRVRNILCHENEAKISKQSYDRYRLKLMGVLNQQFEYIKDKKLEEAITSSLEEINDGSSFTLSESEVKRCIYLWYTSERAIEQKLDSLCEGTSFIIIYVHMSPIEWQLYDDAFDILAVSISNKDVLHLLKQETVNMSNVDYRKCKLVIKAPVILSHSHTQRL